tara:strand:- start:1165 stop:1431 length:267 start_codon:yes stop_codon:yes gene_type:complete
MAKKGGKQPGAGRPIGSTTKPRISDYLSEERIRMLVNKAIDTANEGDVTMLKFILEQHFGKAIQPVEGELKGNITVTFDNTFKDNVTS